MDINDWNSGINALWESTRYDAEHNLAETGSTTRLHAYAKIENGDSSYGIWARQMNEPTSGESITRFSDPATGYLKRAFAVTLGEGPEYGVDWAMRF